MKPAPYSPSAPGVSTYKIEQATAVKRHDEKHGTTLLEAVKGGDMDLRTAAAAAAAAKSAANAFGVMSVKTARPLEGRSYGHALTRSGSARLSHRPTRSTEAHACWGMMA